MRFIPLQKWYDIILCCHSNRRVQTWMVSWLWRRVIYGNRVAYPFHSAMVWNACHALQWYEIHTNANFEKSKTHIFLKSINSLLWVFRFHKTKGTSKTLLISQYLLFYSNYVKVFTITNFGDGVWISIAFWSLLIFLLFADELCYNFIATNLI